MAASTGGRTLEQTPTWAVATVCFVLLLVSIFIEHIIHLIGKWLKKKHKKALYEALEKIKSALEILGIRATRRKSPQTNTTYVESSDDDEGNRRRLLMVSDPIGSVRRVLAGGGETDKCAAKGKVPFVSADGIHQLHIFIFVLAVFHVLYCIITLVLGRAKMRSWKHWEKETRTAEYQFSHDPERFRFARETSFGRRHMSFWSKTPVLLWIVCFFRQFVRSVPKVDYLTLRHGFIMIILLVGTKLQVIITKMALRIQERGEVVKGVPVVQPGDDLFWFNRPRLILYLINFVLFQNAFQLAFFAWTWYEFGLQSCFHEHLEDVIIRVSMGIVIQILCSYVTLPLYALVTQMGSTMKPTIFNERVATALRNWHHTAKKHLKQQNRQSGLTTPMSSRPATPSHGLSPMHLLRHNRSDFDSLQTSPRRSNFDVEHWETDGSPSPSHHHFHGEGSSSHHPDHGYVERERDQFHEPSSSQVAPMPQHAIDIGPKEFSFDKRTSTK
ncbi:hypothetical protein L1049_012768 [Liquidambar formosana]|uniref:MLO-like protein n=1 Tax=Liquidambar formosana TaxID=63359 RepID=A0AAP0RKJ6_LIQFO